MPASVASAAAGRRIDRGADRGQHVGHGPAEEAEDDAP